MPDRNDVANLAKRQKIDWEKIHITVTEDDSPNPQNPYSRLSPKERETAPEKTLPVHLSQKFGKAKISTNDIAQIIFLKYICYRYRECARNTIQQRRKGMMIKCGLYARVSTDLQAEVKNGSLDTQIDLLQKYTEVKDSTSPEEEWKAVAIYREEGRSGKNVDRPEYQRMVRDIENGKINAVLCTRIDQCKSIYHRLFAFP